MNKRPAFLRRPFFISNNACLEILQFFTLGLQPCARLVGRGNFKVECF